MLEDWLIRHELTLIEFEQGNLSEPPVPNEAEARIALFCIGGEPLDATRLQQLQDAGRKLASVPRVIIADNERVPDIIAAFKEGVRGFITTRSEPDEVKQILTFILTGGSYFPPTSLLELAEPRGDVGNANGEETSRNPHGLTGRQNEVLACIREGKSNKVIARELSMRESTVKVHVRQILRKLGADNRTQAALRAMELNGAGAEDFVGGVAEVERPMWQRGLVTAERAVRLVTELPARDARRSEPKAAV